MKRAPQLKFYQDAQGDWRWRVVAGNGRILADSGEGYRRRKACEDAANTAGRALYSRLISQGMDKAAKVRYGQLPPRMVQ